VLSLALSLEEEGERRAFDYGRCWEIFIYNGEISGESNEVVL